MQGDRHAAGETNRAMWNATADVHERHTLDELLEAAKDPRWSTLDALERRVLARIGVEGAAVAQLSCNNGRELISVERLGASRAVGFDISDGFVGQAARLARAAGSGAEFVRTDVYDIGRDYDEAFDLVYVTVGALGWLADLPAWYEVVARILRPRGRLFVYEMHPVLDMFDASTGLEPRRSYFGREPDVVEEAPDYMAPDELVSATSIWFHHTLGDVIGGALRAGLLLEEFEEHAHDVSQVYRAFADLGTVPPMSYHLVARKPD